MLLRILALCCADLENAPVWVHFHSTNPRFNTHECWGNLRDAPQVSPTSHLKMASPRAPPQGTAQCCTFLYCVCSALLRADNPVEQNRGAAYCFCPRRCSQDFWQWFYMKMVDTALRCTSVEFDAVAYSLMLAMAILCHTVALAGWQATVTRRHWGRQLQPVSQGVS